MAVCEMGLAVDRRYKSKDGEQKNDTLFINVKSWDKSAEYCGQYLKKGRPILVEGELRGEEWEDKNTGQKRTTIKVNATRVHILDWDDRSGGGGSGANSSSGASSSSGQQGRPQPRTIEEPIPEDDIPF